MQEHDIDGFTDTAEIKFTQYLFPDRRRRIIYVRRPIEICKLADELAQADFYFDIENNRGQIWMTCIHKKNEDWHADMFCKNGPEVPDKVDELVRAAHMLFIPLKEGS